MVIICDYGLGGMSYKQLHCYGDIIPVFTAMICAWMQ